MQQEMPEWDLSSILLSIPDSSQLMKVCYYGDICVLVPIEHLYLTVYSWNMHKVKAVCWVCLWQSPVFQIDIRSLSLSIRVSRACSPLMSHGCNLHKKSLCFNDCVNPPSMCSDVSPSVFPRLGAIFQSPAFMRHLETWARITSQKKMDKYLRTLFLTLYKFSYLIYWLKSINPSPSCLQK